MSAGLAIYDTMQHIKPDVSTVCVGLAASIAAVLLTGGTKGKRYSLPNARVMIHQPSMHGLSGPAADLEINVREVVAMRQRLEEILARHTGQPLERIKKDADRDFYMSPEEAKEYGLIDEVLTPKKAKAAAK